MVALKLFQIEGIPLDLVGKQERRGGIETRSSHRTGGTRKPEAGTPWWH